MKSDKVLVLGSEKPASVAITRSLARNGLKVITGGSVGYAAGMLSKWSSGKFIHTDLWDNHQKFIDELKDHLREENYFAVFPVTDKTSFLLSKHKETLEETGTMIAAEDWSIMKKVYDKGTTFKIAEKIDIPMPQTYYPQSITEVEEISKELDYPVVIKPRSKSFWDENKIYFIKITEENYANNQKELVDYYRKILSNHPILKDHPPLIQEYIEGEIHDTVVLSKEGEIKRYAQNKRVRTYPASGGAYTMAEGIKPDPKMLDSAKKIINELSWTGPAMVEFLKKDDEYYLVEINGRYWGLVPLTIHSGFDVPSLHYQQLKGQEIEKKMSYEPDKKVRWLLPGDLLWLYENVQKGNMKSVIPFTKSFFDAKNAMCEKDDPLPIIGALAHMFSLGLDVISGKRSISGERV